LDTDLDHVGGCMANYSKFIKLLLSFVIAISPIVLINNANAASLGGWTLGGGVAEGASTVYNGTKNVLINGKNVVQKGVATVTPTASGVAKVLARGAAGYALSIAVEQLLGAVDWVLDPANNQVKYYLEPDKPADCSVSSSCPSAPLIYYVHPELMSDSPSSACNMYTAWMVSVQGWGGNSTLKNTSVSGSSCVASVDYGSGTPVDRKTPIVSVVNPAFDPTAEKERDEKSIPLETVAQKVISNAESGDTSAQAATTAAAADIVAEAEKDNVKARPIVNQLESSAQTSTDETATGEATKPNTADPTAPPDVTNISLKFPVFCGWAPTVCQAASVVISFPTLVTEWWETANTKADGWATSISESWAAAKEWATSEPSQDNTQVDVENNNTQEIDTQVSFSSQCPANIKLADFSYHGISQSWDVDFSKFCDVFATYLRPVVISIGAFSAVLIVSGVGVRENG